MSRISGSIAGSIALAAVIVSAAGCGSQAGPEAPGQASSEVKVSAVNRHLSSVILYLDAGGGPRRLNVLGRGRAMAFTIPWRYMSGSDRVRFVARDVAGGLSVASSYVEVQPGGEVEWTIEQNLLFSSVTVK